MIQNSFLMQTRSLGKKEGLKTGDTSTITFITNDLSGKELKKQYVFAGDGYKIGIKIQNDNLKNNRLTISWNAGIFESENNFRNSKRGGYQIDERKAHYFDGENVQHIQMKKSGKEDVTGFFKWIGVSSKYFFVALVADTQETLI